ncbi:hypothetical protein AGMMS50230_17560 [Spirochaetia bacterium]|nr:hypothetical protein AGMMS50230_17560 [Spirochaetia bacterium]
MSKTTGKAIFMLVMLSILLTACGNPSGSGSGSSGIWSGGPVGTPRFLYLGSDNKPIAGPDADTGKTLVFIDGNPRAETVVVSAFTGSESNDDAVYVTNSKNNSIVSFFFHKGQAFPWQLLIQQDGVETTASLVVTDRATPRGTIVFSNGVTLSNISLFMTPYKGSAALPPPPRKIHA